MTPSPQRLPWLILPCALAAAILTHPPTQAAGPLVLLAKQVVQKMLTDFIEDRIADGIRASFGPCKQDLANDVIERSRAVTGLLGSGGPSVLGAVGSLGGATQALQSTQALQAAQSARGVGGAALPSVAAQATGVAGALGPGAARAIEIVQAKDRVEQAVGKAQDASVQVKSAVNTVNRLGAGASAPDGGAVSASPLLGMLPGLTGNGGGAASDDASQVTARMHDLVRGSVSGLASGQASAGMDTQGAMAQMQSMMSAPPLTPPEMAELSHMLERLGKVAEAVEPGTPACSAADYQRLFMRLTVAGADPRMGGMAMAMTGGMLRMFHTSLKQMSQDSAESEALFTKMSPQDRAEYIETTALELKLAPPQARRAFIAMLDADLIGAPADMRVALKARLAP